MDLVTVARFDFPFQAHLAASRLEHAGVPAFVADEQLVGMSMFHSRAAGGVKLRVPSDRVGEATEILHHMEEAVDPDFEPPTQVCPACGSDDVSPLPPTGVLGRFLGSLLKTSESIRLQCQSCDETWTIPPEE
jgi:hypothetical protein